MNNIFFFPHYANTYTHPNILRMWNELGIASYGIYWLLLEYLCVADNNRALLTDVHIVANLTNYSYDNIMKIIKNYGLFSYDDKYFWSNHILDTAKSNKEKSEKAKLSALKRWASNNGDANALRTQCERNAIKENKSKENKSKEKKSKLDNKNYSEEIIKEAKDFVDYFIKLLPEKITITNTNIEDWINTYITIVYKKNKNKEELKKIVEWARNDNFWSKNFLSLSKLLRKNKDGITYYDVFLSHYNNYTANKKIDNNKINFLADSISNIIINKKI